MRGSLKEKYMTISCVLPCLNEEENIGAIIGRLKAVFEKTNDAYEIICVDDGSRDRTWQVLKDLEKKNPRLVGVRFNRNYGQHAAILAGFEVSAGEYVVTIDADLQNPPEEIPRLLNKAREGYDVVGGWRWPRKDPIVRKFLSKMMNLIISRSIKLKMHDYGCMLRVYKRDVVDRILRTSESATFVPALGVLFAGNVAEVKIRHESRKKSPSRYNIFSLVRLNYDLMTGFSLLPIQALTFVGIVISLIGFALSLYLIIKSFIIGNAMRIDAVYAMFAVLYFFIGILVLSVGIVGEYIGRIYSEVRKRPRFVVKEYAGREKK